MGEFNKVTCHVIGHSQSLDKEVKKQTSSSNTKFCFMSPTGISLEDKSSVGSTVLSVLSSCALTLLTVFYE